MPHPSSFHRLPLLSAIGAAVLVSMSSASADDRIEPSPGFRASHMTVIAAGGLEALPGGRVAFFDGGHEWPPWWQKRRRGQT